MSLGEYQVSRFYKKITTQNTDKAVYVIVCPDPALSECSDIDSDSDANEELNKQLPGKSKTASTDKIFEKNSSFHVK